MERQTFLVTGARAPVALHMARLLGSAGHRVILTDTMRRPLGAATRFARSCAAARACAPSSLHVLAQPAPLAYSSEASQQSHTPSFTAEEKRYCPLCPRLVQ